MYKLGIMVFFVFLNCLLYSQKNSMSYEYLTVDNGLSSNRIQTIYRDHKDFVWIGTADNGLNKFDGCNVVTYEHNDSNINSISSNFIHCILEDKNNHLWVGTFDGLNLYDPKSDNFTIFRYKEGDSNSISGDNITSITEDKRGNLWIGTALNGLNKWDENTHSFIRYQSDSLESHFNNEITDFSADSEGNIWIVNRQRGIALFRPTTGQFLFYKDLSVFSDNFIKTICIDNQDEIWIGSKGGGLCYFDPQMHKFIHFNNRKGHERLNSTMVGAIINDDENHLLIATDQGGINRYNKRNHSFEYIQNYGCDSNGLNNNGVVSLYKDKEDILWVGTSRGGVNYCNPKRNKFKKYIPDHSDRGSLDNRIIGCFCEDHKGMIWIGTDGGGVLVFNPNTQQFVKSFIHNDNDLHSLSGDVIRSIQEDKDGNLWISTWENGLNFYERKTGYFYPYLPNRKDKYRIADKTIWNMKIDQNDNVWLGTFNSGVEVLNKENGIVKRYDTKGGSGASLSSNNICFLYEEGQSYMWICTNYGLDCLDKKKNLITKYSCFEGLNVRAFCIDKEGYYWAGCLGKGLFKFNKKGDILESYNKKNGLPDNTINAIVVDHNGILWITTKKGLSKLEPKTKQIKNYYESDGLVCNNFIEQSFLKSKDGEIYVGGDKGFNSFYPDSINDNEYISNVYFTDFKVFNKSVPICKKSGILSQHISETKQVVLSWNQSSFSFDFIAINYTSPDQNKYAYKLEGLDKNWNYVGNRRDAVYTNVDPGEYIFKVKVVNEGVEDREVSSLQVTIQPPYWKTIYAYLFYFLISVGLILLSWRIVRDRERLRHAVEMEKQKSLRDRELDLMKIKFFTNVSHDFRTPLSLIISPLKDLIKQEKDNSKKEKIMLVFRNAKRLLNLVNQLLDFRKIEVGKLNLCITCDDIIAFTKDIFSSFSDVSSNKGIKMYYHSNVKDLYVCFDKDKVEKILLNLISNAFKFTLEEGRIELSVNMLGKTNSGDYVDVEFSVCDTGIGISKDKQAKIFQPFFQNELPEGIINQGSGIGLSIIQEFVKLHGGTIKVSSEVNKGSCFTVQIPLAIADHKNQCFDNVNEGIIIDKIQPEVIEEVSIENEVDGKPALLLVEDEDDFRFYLKDNLKFQYNVLEAKNGKEAFEETIKEVPDIIISDVMMPYMDGLELCSLIKKDKRTSHIPVVLLTAKASEGDEIEGLNVGADDYLRKPFSFEVLESRVRNILTQRKLLKDVFHKQVLVKPSDIEITSIDEKLLQEAIQLVERNISNVSFSVEELSKEIGISRGHLYHKLLTITGYSPIEFIRFIRIKRARQLLDESQLSVAEIAFQVGFNNPKLFTKYFKQEFQITPSLYKKSRSKM